MNAAALKKTMRAAGYRSAARNLEQRIRDFGLPLDCPSGITVDRMVVSGKLAAMRGENILVDEEKVHIPSTYKHSDPRERARRGDHPMRGRPVRMSDEVWAAMNYSGKRAELIRQLCEAHLAAVGKVGWTA